MYTGGHKFLTIRLQFSLAVLRKFRFAITGLGVGTGGLLLFAACKVRLLLLVQKDRKRMSQLAECAVNCPSDVGRNLLFEQI